MWLNRIFPYPNSRVHRSFHSLCALMAVSLAVALSFQQAFSQGKPIKDKTKRDFDNNCMRSGCHGGLNETAWVHGPVAVGSCDICHKENGPKKDHKFKLLREKEKVCTYCHQGNVTGKVVHKTVTDHGCLKCHNPHGGEKRNLLLVQDEVKLCTECHKPQYYSPKAVLSTNKAEGSTAPPAESSVDQGGNLRPEAGEQKPEAGGQKTEAGGNEPKAGNTTPNTENRTQVTTPPSPKALRAKSVIAETQKVPLTQGMKKEEIKKLGLKKFQFVHKPITEGKCLSCHDAHSSDHKGLLPVAERDLCIVCHKDWKDFKKSGLNVHTPAQENCLSCHMKHGGNVDKLLVRQSKDLCLSCHTHVDGFIKTGTAYEIKMVEDKDEGPPAPGATEGQAVKKDKKTAEVNTKKESKSFKPTSTASTKSTTSPSTLHSPLSTPPAEKPPVKMKAVYVGEGMKMHKGIKDAKSCLVCHEHHAANNKVLVHADIKKPCLSCHNEAIKVDKKTVIANIKAEIDDAKSVHGPVADGKCLHCHKGHSSAHTGLLTHGHTERLYAEYSKDSYDLCYTCHDRSVAEDKKSKATNFRDGDNNLHFLHIRDEGIKNGNVASKKKVKGRTCNVCHDMHAGSQKSLIRPDLPYGKGGWKLKIDFKQTPIGGSCTVACHKKKEYRHASTEAGVDTSWKERVKKTMQEKGYK